MSAATTRAELIREAVLALAADADALADLCTDGMISREMAVWALRTATARFVPRVLAERSATPDLTGRSVAVVLAESVPTAPLRAIALPLLRGASRVLVRPPRGQARFAQRVVARLARLPVECVDTGDPTAFLRDAYAQGVTRVIAFGADATLVSIANARPHGVTVEARGHGFGIAVVGAEASMIDTAADIARDIVHYDQFGCLSPRAVFVQSESAAPFAERLAVALARLAAELPRGPLDPELAARITQWQGAVAATAAAFHRGAAYGVAALGSAGFMDSPGARNVTVVPVTDAEHALGLLGASLRHLTCVGVGGDHAPVRRALSAASRSRVVTAGTMQDPPLDGYEDPRPPIVSGPD